MVLDDLDRLCVAFDLDRLGAELDLDGVDRLRAASSPVAFDPEACRHWVRVVVLIKPLIDLSLSSKCIVSSSRLVGVGGIGGGR